MLRVDLDGQPVCIGTGDHSVTAGRPCCVMVHGAANDHFVWAQIVRGLDDGSRTLLAPDLPGHGQSGGRPLASIEAMAGWLLALLEKVGAGATAGVTLVGHSMGSLVALEAAARAPQRIRHLVMIGTAVPMPVAPALLEAAEKDPPAALRMINRWSYSAAAARGAIGGHGLWLPTLGLRIMERQPHGVVLADLAACNAYATGLAAAARLACPVTLVAGSADRMTRPQAARAQTAALRETNPALPVDLIEIPGAGHAMPAEAPGAVCAAIRRACA